MHNHSYTSVQPKSLFLMKKSATLLFDTQSTRTVISGQIFIKQTRQAHRAIKGDVEVDGTVLQLTLV